MNIISANFINHRDKPMTFRWALVDRSYAARWFEVMRAWKAGWPTSTPNWNEKWFVGSTEEDFLDLFGQVKSKVNEIESLGVYKIEFSENQSVTPRAQLNKIHRAFHEYVESANIDFNNPKAVLTVELCHQLNDLVHLAESAYANSQSPFQSLCIIGTGKPHLQVPYEVSDFAECTPSRVSGWLYLGYATPGKTLFQCFEDRDVEVIRKKLVRPSQGIANEFHLELNGHAGFDEAYDAAVRNDYYAWCDQVGAEEFGYDCRAPIHGAGRIPLASPLDDINRLVHHIGGREGRIVDLILE